MHDLSNNFSNNLDISSAQGTGVITNDDTASLAIDDVTVTEGDSGLVNAIFTVTLTGSTSSAFTVDYATNDNTATSGSSDYISDASTLSFAGTAGETKTIVLDVEGDTIVEADELFDVDLSNLSNTFSGNLTISDAQGCLLYTSPSPRDATLSRMPSSA